MKEFAGDKTTLCPSARPESVDSVVFGVIGGTVTKPHVAYLKHPQPVTDELIAKASPITPAEIFRTAAPCATKACQHFDGQDCRLATRIVEKLPVVAEELPPCSIRRDCRWWQQEGKAACMRCPQVITDNYNPSELAIKVATPIVG
ncbi:nitrogen fixation protein [Nostoc sp. WHI]|uniref:nitrogen fixation protein n=1 Tax=Nostoc sp. WHI TaxID=2650611 RepID=UPI0018C7BDE0|nr:nitrogen fixation protein [Nostoc sp. WHI]MBG1267514.1 nitrogen fixation protein [Nostoc sp. WHI]MBG1267523.1 nitrogen fixation protein [Nostoc sp. WHI]